DIDLALMVKSKSGEIKTFIKEFDEELRREYFSLLSMPDDSSDYLIDAHVLNEEAENDPSRAYLLHIIKNDSVAIPAG
ncbi:MAG TPA: hypothetical protein VHR42_09870, partial [Clostridia bacterium]|nr:hypothetical protein [Clostridia bacterium]